MVSASFYTKPLSPKIHDPGNSENAKTSRPVVYMINDCVDRKRRRLNTIVRVRYLEPNDILNDSGDRDSLIHHLAGQRLLVSH